MLFFQPYQMTVSTYMFLVNTKETLPKLLLQTYVRDINNDTVRPVSQVGISEERDKKYYNYQ